MRGTEPYQAFLLVYAILAGDATTGKLEHAMIGREKIGGQQKKKQKQGGKQKNPKIQRFAEVCRQHCTASDCLRKSNFLTLHVSAQR